MTNFVKPFDKLELQTKLWQIKKYSQMASLNSFNASKKCSNNWVYRSEKGPVGFFWLSSWPQVLPGTQPHPLKYWISSTDLETGCKHVLSVLKQKTNKWRKSLIKRKLDFFTKRFLKVLQNVNLFSQNKTLNWVKADFHEGTQRVVRESIYSQLSGLNTARGSSTFLVTVGPTKVKVCKSIIKYWRL